MLNVSILVRLLVTVFLFSAANLHAESQRIIVHGAYEGAELSRNTARAIFSMRLKRWDTGNSITVFVLPDGHPAHRQFTREVLSLFPHQLRRSWDRYVYSGIGTAPIVVKNQDEMIQRVAKTQGSIGYTSQEIGEAYVRALPVR